METKIEALRGQKQLTKRLCNLDSLVRTNYVEENQIPTRLDNGKFALKESCLHEKPIET